MWMLIFALACEDHAAESQTEAEHAEGAHGEGVHKEEAHAGHAEDAHAGHAEDAHAGHGEGAHAGHAADPNAEPSAVALAAADQALTLTLNDGARWQLDESTRSVFAESRSSLKGGDPATLEEAHALAATLKEQQGRLIRGCTMTGSSHDELHTFLKAWIPGVKALGDAKTLAEAQAQVVTLRGYADAMDLHFE